jgi:hypothetical protein
MVQYTTLEISSILCVCCAQLGIACSFYMVCGNILDSSQRVRSDSRVVDWNVTQLRKAKP